MNRQGKILRTSVIRFGSITALALLAAALVAAPVQAQETETSATTASGAVTAEPEAETTEGAPSEGEDVAPEDVELRDPSEVAPGTRLHASVEMLASWTDNFFYQTDNQESVVGYFVTPTISYGSASPRIRSNTQIGANLGFYSLDGSSDDYRDLRASTNLGWKVAPAHRLGYDIAVNTGHDPFGLVRTEAGGGTSRSLDRWVNERYQLEYRYGAPRSAFSIENKGFITNKAYRTNRVVPGTGGLGTRFLDYDTQGLDSVLLYHYSPKTHLMLNLVTTHINFNLDFPSIPAREVPSRDAQEYRIRTGVRWIATAKTSGDFRIGYVTRRFVDSRVSSTNRFDWMVGADWTPITRTLLQLQTGRQSIESYNEASYIDVSYVNFTWRQEWLPRLTTQARLGYSYADFVNLGRHDDSFTLNVRADYRLKKWITLFAGYDLDNRGSSDGFFEYDKNTVYVGLRAHY